MDTAQAKIFADELIGKVIGGWTIDEYIDCGKSAVVLKAYKNESAAAVKVFHSELVELYSREQQLERIHRETSLVGAHHPSLVKILGGGECNVTRHLFVVMEYLPLSNLKE